MRLFAGARSGEIKGELLGEAAVLSDRLQQPVQPRPAPLPRAPPTQTLLIIIVLVRIHHRRAAIVP